MSRYQRQVGLPEFGAAAQAALAASRVLVVGCGGLGSVAGQYLAAAGVGSLTLVDGDEVERSNLPRQLWFDERSVGQPKAECAAERLRSLNPELRLTAKAERLGRANALAMAESHDLIVDCVDDFETKQLLNEVALRRDLPLVFASVTGFDGMVATFHPGHGPCLRCLFPFTSLASPTSCALNGVLGPAVGVVGSWQALEAIRVLAQGKIDPAIASRPGALWSIDLRTGATQVLSVPRRPDCVCQEKSAPLLGAADIAEPTWKELEGEGEYGLLDVREESEFSRGSVPGARNFPLSRIEAGSLPDFLAQKGTWAVFCARGVRSRRAAELLSAAAPVARYLSVHGGLELNPCRSKPPAP